MKANTGPCGCTEYNQGRRNFLRGLGGLAGIGAASWAFGDVFTEVVYGSSVDSPNVLLVLSLRGGADGLSMAVPHADAHYYEARPRTGIPAARLLARDSTFGLHPALAPVLPLWNTGRFGVVHAVGLPSPNRSHFAAMAEVEDAAPGSAERRGWINRMVGLVGGADPVQAVGLGVGSVAGSLFGTTPTMSLATLRDLRLASDGAPIAQQTRASLEKAWAHSTSPMGVGARAALSVSSRLSSLSAPTAPENGATYPPGSLAASMAEAARLIRANVGARVVTVDAGNWDMHNNIGTADQGDMFTRLNELARVISAFFTDLGSSSSRVTLVTISEFGRRATENGNNGLDHGYGSCMMLFGAGIQGGRYIAKWPGLGQGNLVDGDLQVTTDYRDVLAEVVASRFPEVSIAELFPGFHHTSVGIA